MTQTSTNIMYKKMIILLFLIIIVSISTLLYGSCPNSIKIDQPKPDRLTNELCGITPLHCATTVEDALFILKYDADINAPDTNGQTPIQYMIDAHHMEAACYLLSQNAQISENDKKKLLLYQIKSTQRSNLLVMTTTNQNSNVHNTAKLTQNSTNLDKQKQIEIPTNNWNSNIDNKATCSTSEHQDSFINKPIEKKESTKKIRCPHCRIT